MAKMNGKKKAQNSVKDVRTTVNHEGCEVHELRPLETLFSKVLGSFFGESTFYESRTAEKDFSDLFELISKVPYEDREYVLKVALLGREHNMIHYPLAVLTACFNDERFKGEGFLDSSGKNKLQFYSDRIVRRGKDIVDVMGMQFTMFGFDRVLVNSSYHRNLPLPIQLRKSLKHKLETMSEYQLSKALSEGSEVSLADCIKLLRPNEKVSKVRKGFFSKVISGSVDMGAGRKQVQSELSKSRNANSESTVKDVKDSLSSSSLMAIVKNLVALERAGVLKDSKSVDLVVSKLTDPKQVRESKMLPFRFYSAWKALSSPAFEQYGVRCVKDALIQALDLSVANLPKMKGYSAILIDRSGSMRQPISEMSSVTAEDISILLGAICFKQGVGEVFVFADECTKISNLSRVSTVMDIVESIKKYSVGFSTNLCSALKTISADVRKNEPYTNLIILSDGDCYNSSGNSFTLKSYSYWLRSPENPNTLVLDMFNRGYIKKLYLNNLLGNNFTVANTDDYRNNLITGFSERIVEMINMYDAMGGNSDIREVIDSLLEGSLR